MDKHPLAAGLEAIGPTSFNEAKYAYIAAEAVVARLLGIIVNHAYVDPTPTAHFGGNVQTTGGDAQHLCVYMAAGPIGAVMRLQELEAADHPLTAPAIEELAGQQNNRQAAKLLEEGYVVWRRRAAQDAEHLLEQIFVWEAVLWVAEALKEAGRRGLAGDEIDAAMHGLNTEAVSIVWRPCKEA